MEGFTWHHSLSRTNLQFLFELCKDGGGRCVWLLKKLVPQDEIDLPWLLLALSILHFLYFIVFYVFYYSCFTVKHFVTAVGEKCYINRHNLLTLSVCSRLVNTAQHLWDSNVLAEIMQQVDLADPGQAIRESITSLLLNVLQDSLPRICWMKKYENIVQRFLFFCFFHFTLYFFWKFSKLYMCDIKK